MTADDKYWAVYSNIQRVKHEFGVTHGAVEEECLMQETPARVEMRRQCSHGTVVGAPGEANR
jgi:hypothetical protein